MKRITSIILLLIVAMLPAMAQITHDRQGQHDATAAAILKKAAARFDQNVSFTVAATMFDANKKQTGSQRAQVLYNRGKYRLTLDDQVVICDGTTLWHWNKTAREVMINNLGTDDIDLLNPGRLLAGYERSFRAKYIRTEEDGTAVVDLQPRSSRSFHKIRLLIDEKSGLLKRMEVHKYDSSREVYDVSAFKRANTPAAQFTFDAKQHAGIEIIDMR